MVLAAKQHSESADEALEWLCRAYWPAVHVFVRRTVRDPEQARDLTQEFFARLLEKQWLAAADQEKGRFRTFLLVMVKRFLADQHDRATARKRGGGARLLSLEELAREEERPFEPGGGLTPDQDFDRRWALAVLDSGLRRLRAEALKGTGSELFDALQGCLSGGQRDDSLVEIGARFGLGASAAKMRVHRWRARLGELIREEVAQTVPRLADLEEEMRHLLQALAPQ
jgi:RNA polymerase sigma-70 factor (ECF subfamily)